MTPSEEKVWLKYFEEGVKNAPLPQCTIFEYVKETSKNYRSNPAINYYGRKYTYTQLIEKSESYARGFASLGVKKGDVVCLISTTLPESVFSVYGLNHIGAAACLLDPRMNLQRIGYFIKLTKAKTVMIIDKAWEKCRPLIDECKLDHAVIQPITHSLPAIKAAAMKLKSGTVKANHPKAMTITQFENMAKKAPYVKAAPYEKDSVCLITLTGGTTGMPKGVGLTNEGVNGVAYNFYYSGVDHGENDRFLDIIPMFSSYGVVCTMHMPFIMGCELGLTPEYSIEKIGQQFAEFKPNHMLAVPSFYEAIADSPLTQKMDLSFALTLGTGGDTTNSALEEKVHTFIKERGAKYPMAQGYGMSECSSAASFGFSGRYKSQSSGYPGLCVDMGVFEPGTDKELGYNEVGEICMAGPILMKGYYNNPEETKKVLIKHKDGKVWLHSKDLGYMDEDGFIFIEGREKHMITRYNGHKDFPQQYKAVLEAHPAVANCDVVGIKDRKYAQGKLPLVVIELKDKYKDQAESLRLQLLKLCSDSLPPTCQPADLVIIDKMLYTPMGKNDTAALTEKYKDFDYTQESQF